MQANPFVKSMKPFENLAPILKTSFLAVLNHCIDFLEIFFKAFL
jgi:hypothetical protein